MDPCYKDPRNKDPGKDPRLNAWWLTALVEGSDR
jgi:hypothetical protein